LNILYFYVTTPILVIIFGGETKRTANSISITISLSKLIIIQRTLLTVWDFPFVFECNFAILMIRNLRIKSIIFESTNCMYLSNRSYKSIGMKPKDRNNEALRRNHILLHIHKTGFTNGTLLFVSVSSGLVCD
jgi:hypothetical protein